jgi:protocatechuate 3,4-dioxygenase beta subunit
MIRDATGELLRQNLTESEIGVPLHLDILVLDHTTCNPVKSQFVEIWSTNSTV